MAVFPACDCIATGPRVQHFHWWLSLPLSCCALFSGGNSYTLPPYYTLSDPPPLPSQMIQVTLVNSAQSKLDSPVVRTVLISCLTQERYYYYRHPRFCIGCNPQANHLNLFVFSINFWVIKWLFVLQLPYFFWDCVHGLKIGS